jgi:TonB family protein
MNDRMRRLIPVLTLAMMVTSKVPAVPSADAPVAPHLTAPVVLNEKAARGLLVYPVFPEYPPVAKINYLQGKARLQVMVSQKGKVTAAHILKGNPILAASALKAVRKWLYRPLQTALGPTEFQADVAVKFTLQYRNNRLLPPKAEQDLTRQIRAPEIVEKRGVPQPSSAVRLRVLVNEEGCAVDYELLSGQTSAFGEARQVVDGWRFLPARWGTIAVPWYLEVDVPGGCSFLSATGPEVSSQ